MSLTILQERGQPVPFKSWDFPDGAVGFRLLSHADTTIPATIIARIQSSRDFVELVMAVGALEERGERVLKLVLPCVPNQRQDRACVNGEPVGVLAFARQVAALGIKHVTMFDPHSEVTPTAFKAFGMTVVAHSQATVIGQFAALNKRIIDDTNLVFVSPDAGANKKTSDLAAIYGHDSFLRADKLRDLATGKIKEIVVVNPREEVEGRDCIVLDDLGDRCGTFIGLAKALKAKGARSVEVYLTHLLLTAPLDTILGPLFEAGVTRVWGTNSYRTDLNDPRLTVLNLEDSFSL